MKKNSGGIRLATTFVTEKFYKNFYTFRFAKFVASVKHALNTKNSMK